MLLTKNREELYFIMLVQGHILRRAHSFDTAQMGRSGKGTKNMQGQTVMFEGLMPLGLNPFGLNPFGLKF